MSEGSFSFFVLMFIVCILVMQRPNVYSWCLYSLGAGDVSIYVYGDRDWFPLSNKSILKIAISVLLFTKLKLHQLEVRLSISKTSKSSSSPKEETELHACFAKKCMRRAH